MPVWLLRVLAFAVSLASMAGSTGYVLAHPKNPAAPLQPAVAEPVETDEPMPTPAPRTERPVTPSPTPRPTATPTARPTVAVRLATPTGTVAAVVNTTAPVPTPVPTPVATPRPTPVPTVRPMPVPTIQIAAGVRATALPRITVTHRS